MKQINITIGKDLTEVKEADTKTRVLNVIHKWLIEINSEKKQEFRSEFLSDENDKYFQELKDLIGEFKKLPKISVLDFLCVVICGDKTKSKILKELQEEFNKLRANFYAKKK